MICQPDDPRRGKELWDRFRRAVDPGKIAHCPDAAGLAAYADGRVSRSKVREIEEHLSACPACLAALCELRSLLATELRDIPADIGRRAKGLVREPAPARGPSWVWLPAFTLRSAPVWAASAALILASCTAGYLMGRGSSSESGPGISSNYMAPGFNLNGAGETGGGDVSPHVFTGGLI